MVKNYGKIEIIHDHKVIGTAKEVVIFGQRKNTPQQTVFHGTVTLHGNIIFRQLKEDG